MATRSRATITLLIAALAALAAVRLGYETWRLVLDAGPGGAVDLRHMRRFILWWFDGRPVYRMSDQATWPPATFVLMWPFAAALPWDAARWVWALVTGAGLAGLVVLGLREAGLGGAPEPGGAGRADPRARWAGALLLLAMAPTGVTIGNGQMTIVQLAAFLAAVVLLRRPPGWGRDLIVALALLAAVIKPHVTAPIFWVLLFALGGFRPVALAVAAYAALTAFAISFQVIPLGELLHDYLDRSRSVADFGGFMNLHAWLGAVGLRGWSLPASLVVFAATALWVHHRRRVDPWLLLGATAIVARLWTYHDVYDDVLMVFPLIALWRLIGGGAAAAGGAVGGRAPRVLLAAGALAVLVPSSVVRATSPLGFAASAADALVWLAILVFLVRRTSPRRMVDPEPAPATR